MSHCAAPDYLPMYVSTCSHYAQLPRSNAGALVRSAHSCQASVRLACHNTSGMLTWVGKQPCEFENESSLRSRLMPSAQLDLDSMYSNHTCT
eukprot:465639-Amphidinium_carterae.1